MDDHAKLLANLVRVLLRVPGIESFETRTALISGLKVRPARDPHRDVVDLLRITEALRTADPPGVLALIDNALLIAKKADGSALESDLLRLRVDLAPLVAPERSVRDEPSESVELPHPLLTEFGGLFNLTWRGTRIERKAAAVALVLLLLTLVAALFAKYSDTNCVWADFYRTPRSPGANQIVFGYMAELSHGFYHGVVVVLFVLLAIPWVDAMGRFLLEEYRRGAAFVSEDGRRGSNDVLRWIGATNKRLFRWFLPIAIVGIFAAIYRSEFLSEDEVVFGWVQRPRLEQRLHNQREASNVAEALGYRSLQDFATAPVGAGSPHLDSCLPLVESNDACRPGREQIVPAVQARLVSVRPPFQGRHKSFRVFLLVALLNQGLFHVMTSWLMAKFVFVAVLVCFGANRSRFLGERTRDEPTRETDVVAGLLTLTFTRPRSTQEVDAMTRRLEPIFSLGLGMMGLGCWGLLFNLLSNANKGSVDLDGYGRAMATQALLWAMYAVVLVVVALSVVFGLRWLMLEAAERQPTEAERLLELSETPSSEATPATAPRTSLGTVLRRYALPTFFLGSFAILAIATTAVRSDSHGSTAQFFLRAQQSFAGVFCGAGPVPWEVRHRSQITSNEVAR